MKKTYYVSKLKQPNGEHEVHESACRYLPTPDNRILIGDFAYCSEAVVAAKKYYSQVNGCYYCSNACHTS